MGICPTETESRPVGLWSCGEPVRSQSQEQGPTSSSHSSMLGSSPGRVSGSEPCWKLGLHLRWEDREGGQREEGSLEGSSSQEQKHSKCLQRKPDGDAQGNYNQVANAGSHVAVWELPVVHLI